MKRVLERAAGSEPVRYVVFGVLAGLVNYGGYALFRRLGVNFAVSNVLSWIIAVVFSYYTNKYFVFHRPFSGKAPAFIAAAEFYSSRALVLLLEEALMIFLVGLLSVNDHAAKIVAMVVTGILNYFISKMLVFRNRGKNRSIGNGD